MSKINVNQSIADIWAIWSVILLCSLSPTSFAETNNDITNAGPIVGGQISGSSEVLPEVPRIFRNVTGIINDEFTRPHIPPIRPTKDGRLGVVSQIYNDGVAFVLLNPEKLDQPSLLSERGASIISQSEPYLVSNALLEAPLGFQHGTLCEVNASDPSQRQNPYTCGESGENDCYDVTYVGGESISRDLSLLIGAVNEGSVPDSNHDILYSVPMTVTVSNPKTPSAFISDISVDQSAIKRAEKPYQASTFEHITPGDGRLLIMRSGNQTLTWFNENTQQYVSDAYDIVYSVGDDNAEPCDIEQWTHLYPISHAPYHSLVKSRYDFAAHPFRDPMGHIIRDGDEFKGTYPWMDSKAKNLTMTVLPGPNLYGAPNTGETGARYPTRCVVDGCDESQLQDVPNQHQGFVIMGSWTQGKAVLLDGVLNDIDFELPQHDERHSYVKLYQSGTGIHGTETGEVRMGSSRQVGNEFAPIGTSRNTTIFDSVEARFNYLQNLKPIMPKDVVWHASSGRNSDEFAFDDYVDPNAFIISNMVGAVNFNEGNYVFGRYYDGWNKELQAFSDPVYVQNSSTALRDQWIVPNYGEVHNGRLEPAAVGGIRGKGIWLNGQNSFVQYDIEPQPRRIDAYPWFVSLFIDSRTQPDTLPVLTEQALIRFPDGSELTLLGNNIIKFRDTQGNVVNQLALPHPVENMQWHQIALNIHPDGKRVRFYHNGFPIQEWQSTGNAAPIFQFSEGALLLGKSTQAGVKPFKGWMDEFKVYAHSVTLESVCNHAHGTLLALKDNYQGELGEISANYPAEQQARVSQELTMKGAEPHNRYVCFSNNEEEYGINTHQLPENTVAIGHYINFPEGPLYHDAPRPDSRFNQFCLTCHQPDSTPGLDIEALRLNEQLLAKQDPRRQPMQPDATVYGNIPAYWLPGSPSAPQHLSNEGAFIDEWLLASAQGQSPEIKSLTLVSAETGEDILPLYDGITIDTNQLRTSRLNIRAVTNGLTRQVTFTHNNVSSIEKEAPFALFGAMGHRFNVGMLAQGEHTLSAKAGSGESQVSITFTVQGQNQQNETGDGAIETPLPDENTILDWIIKQTEYFLQQLKEFFDKVLSSINPEDHQLDDGPTLGIYLNNAIRDGNTVSISGRVAGLHTGVILINDQNIAIDNNQFSYQSTTDANEFSLLLNTPQGDQKEALIRFDKQRVINGAEIRLSGKEGLFGHLSQTLTQEASAINELIQGAFDNLPVLSESMLGIDINYTIESVSVNDITIDISPGLLPTSDLTIQGGVQVETIDLHSRFSAVGWCFNWWGKKICPINIQLNPLNVGLDSLTVPFSLSIIPGADVDADNQLLGLSNLDVAIDFDRVRVAIGFIPEWLLGIFIDPLKAFLFPLVEQPIADGISGAITDAVKPLLATIPDGLNIGRAARFHELTKAFPLPDGLLPLVEVLTDGAGVEFSINNLKTQPGFNHIGLDVGVYSLTADDQVHYGYRASLNDNTHESNGDVNVVSMDSIQSQADIQVLLKEATLNKTLATLAQEKILNASLPVSLEGLLAVEGQPLSQEIDAVLSVNLPSSPYVSLPESDAVTARVNIDSVNFTLHSSETLLDEYAEDQVVTLLDLTADLIIDIQYSMVEGDWQTTADVSHANLVSVQAFDIDIPEDMATHIVERLTLAILPQVTRQMTYADALPPLLGLDKTTIQATRPDSARNDLLIELQLLR